MGLRREFVDAHIAKWVAQLTHTYFYPHRAKWPPRLFHHTPIENAARILRSGALLSRTASESSRVLDIADPEIVNTRDRAHDFVRLYFRPRTPTQFWIEGIRRPSEYFKGNKHAPTLIMLVFDARSILSIDGVRFSDGNMQSANTCDGDDENFFSTIDFDRVFHEGPFNRSDPHVIVRRCAEVLAPSPLPLENLSFIYCRSAAERDFLLYKLGDAASKWERRVLVSDDIRVFEKRYTFAEHVSLSQQGVFFELAPRADAAPVNLDVQVKSLFGGKQYVQWGPANLATTNTAGGRRWRIDASLPSGAYIVIIRLEGCLAYENVLFVEDDPF
ncbi:MAG: DarT ssDNA thymidine ADP-ribosyltransferase family protein [Terricaulis sp.]